MICLLTSIFSCLSCRPDRGLGKALFAGLAAAAETTMGSLIDRGMDRWSSDRFVGKYLDDAAGWLNPEQFTQAGGAG